MDLTEEESCTCIKECFWSESAEINRGKAEIKQRGVLYVVSGSLFIQGQ